MSAGTLASRWFVKRRALAIMLAGMGHTISSMVFPILNNHLVSTVGWRTAFRVLGGCLWIVYIPSMIMLMVSRPEDLGMHPDGRAADGESRDKPSEDEEVMFTQAQVLKTRAFWLLAFAFFQFGFTGTGITFHYLSVMG